MTKKFDSKWNFMINSTEDKPNPKFVKVEEGYTLYEMDTGNTFIFYEGEWQEFLNKEGKAGKPNKAKAFCNFVIKSTDKKPDPRFVKIEEGYLCYELDTGLISIWNGEAWEEFKSDTGGGGGMSNYYTKAETNALLDGKEDVKTEHQVIGWTKVDGGFVDLDLRPFIAEGCTKFTILCYIRKGSIRQGIKFELTLSELNKFFQKSQRNKLCITRMIVNPSNENESAMLKQCIQQVYENDVVVAGLIQIMHNVYVNGALVPATSLDNFECCMFGE